jgi:hypothetical protein
MKEKQIHRLLVLDAKGHPVGLISLNDIAREGAETRTARQVSDPKSQASIGLRSALPHHSGTGRVTTAVELRRRHMAYKELHFLSEARESLLRGAKALTDAVRITPPDVGKNDGANEYEN